jgi:hypothetical protein
LHGLGWVLAQLQEYATATTYIRFSYKELLYKAIEDEAKKLSKPHDVQNFSYDVMSPDGSQLPL